MKAYAYRHQVLHLHGQGQSVAAISRALGVPKSSIYALTRVLKLQGYMPANATEQVGKWKPEQESDVIRLYVAGRQLNAIALATNRTLQAIENKVKDLIRDGKLIKRAANSTRAKLAPAHINDTQRDDFAYAVYQYAAMNMGSTDEMIATATGYSLERVKAETKRLSSTLARLLTRDGNGWRQVADRERHTTCAGGNAWAFLKNREAA